MNSNFDFEQLTPEHQQVLDWLGERGAVSPSVLLAQTTHEPKAVWLLVTQLSEWGLLIMRPDADSPDGMLMVVAPTMNQNANQTARKVKR